MAELVGIQHTISKHPTDARGYIALRDHLESHCQRVYNGTCEWQFSPPFNSQLFDRGNLPPRENAAIVYICCADAQVGQSHQHPCKASVRTFVILTAFPLFEQEFSDLLWSLQLLDLNFNDYFRYPVLIFHENFGVQQKAQIQQGTRSSVAFHRVTFDVPSFIDARYVPRWFGGYSLGFRHMIRFFTMELAHHPALAPLDYYWRLDSDSFLIGRVWTDPFHFMAENNFKLGFIATSTERAEFLPGLWELTEAHRRAEGIQLEWFRGNWNGFSFHSSCTIVRVDFWRQAPVWAPPNHYPPRRPHPPPAPRHPLSPPVTTRVRNAAVIFLAFLPAPYVAAPRLV